MCLLVVVSRVVESAPLVVGANRDERLERPATTMTVLQAGSPRILGGRDELAGGTWLAVNEHGLVAGLTNRPAPEGRDPSKRSRGELPLALARHVTSDDAVEDFVECFRPTDFNPASLLVGDRRSLYSIDMAGDRPDVKELPPGVHILENLSLGDPSQKVDHVRQLLGPLGGARTTTTALVNQLQRVLGDHSLPSPETVSACVHTDSYGTRSSIIVSVPAREDAVISVSVADGHPCTAAFSDATGLWRS